MRHWRYYNPQPQCDDCGRFISYERATLCGGSDGYPSPSWDEWWAGKCVKCDPDQSTPTPEGADK